LVEPLLARRGDDVYSATLSCGTVLAYEARSLAPARGESVPCRRHSYCVVKKLGTAPSGRRPRSGLPRARPRDHRELLEWLRGRSATTVHALRNERFTLRMIATAERDGLVIVDLETGMVAVLPGGGKP
jgi:hypothetical protein